jgi:hypothetical protein
VPWGYEKLDINIRGWTVNASKPVGEIAGSRIGDALYNVAYATQSASPLLLGLLQKFTKDAPLHVVIDRGVSARYPSSYPITDITLDNDEQRISAVRFPFATVLGPDKYGISQLSNALLHESLHAALINLGASAEQLWQARRNGIKISAADASTVEHAKILLQNYLHAQEEVFVYKAVEAVYSKDDKTIAFRKRLEGFLAQVAEYLFSKKKMAVETISRQIAANGKETLVLDFKLPKGSLILDAKGSEEVGALLRLFQP